MRIPKPTACIQCSEVKICGIRLLCKHWICSPECFHSLIASQTENRIDKHSICVCPTCKSKIPRELIKDLYGGDENLRKAIRVCSRQFEPKILCEFCYMEKPAGDFITLNCDHRACEDCMKSFVESFIIEGKTGKDISCPQCLMEIDYNIIVNVVDQETRDKYDRFLLRRIETVLRNEVYLKCISRPGVNCDNAEFISVDREEYHCPKCEAHFCVKCKENWHPKMTCQQYQIMKGIDPGIQNDIKNDLATYCPWCNALIYKDGGCKYITCASESCKKEKFFCWDCKTKLNTVHQVHPCHTPDVISNKIKAACHIF